MNYKVRNDFLLVENLESTEEPKESTSGIILPNSSKSSVFWRLKVLGVGTKITDVKVGDIVLGEHMVQELNSNNKKIGIIRDEYVHLIEGDK